MTQAQQGKIISIRSLDPTLYGDQLKNRVNKMYLPTLLLGPDVQNLKQMNGELRDFLDQNRRNRCKHSTKGIINMLAHELYNKTDDRAASIKMAKRINSRGKDHSALLSAGTPIPKFSPLLRLRSRDETPPGESRGSSPISWRSDSRIKIQS